MSILYHILAIFLVTACIIGIFALLCYIGHRIEMYGNYHYLKKEGKVLILRRYKKHSKDMLYENGKLVPDNSFECYMEVVNYKGDRSHFRITEKAYTDFGIHSEIKRTIDKNDLCLFVMKDIENRIGNL